MLLIQTQLKEVADKRINTGSEGAFYESVVEYQRHEQELSLRYQTAETNETLKDVKRDGEIALLRPNRF